MNLVKTTIVLAALSGAAFPATGMAQTFRLACPSAETSPTCIAAQHFADEAAALSDGAIEVQVFPGGQLGSGEAAIQQMRAGVLDLVVEDISNFGNFVNDYNVVSWGFTFRDEEHFLRFLDSDIHQEMIDALREEQGIEILAADWRKLPRVVVATRPVETPEDLAGLKFRVPSIPSYIATWETLGANPTQVPWADSFQALRTGVVDGMEAPLDSVLSQSFHLAAPNVSLTEHVYASMTLAMNGRRFASLSPELQDVLRQASESAADRADELADEFAQEVVAGLEADGSTVIDVDRQAFANLLTAAAHQQEETGLWSEGLYDRIQALD